MPRFLVFGPPLPGSAADPRSFYPCNNYDFRSRSGTIDEVFGDPFSSTCDIVHRIDCDRSLAPLSLQQVLSTGHQHENNMINVYCIVVELMEEQRISIPVSSRPGIQQRSFFVSDDSLSHIRVYLWGNGVKLAENLALCDVILLQGFEVRQVMGKKTLHSKSTPTMSQIKVSHRQISRFLGYPHHHSQLDEDEREDHNNTILKEGHHTWTRVKELVNWSSYQLSKDLLHGQSCHANAGLLTMVISQICFDGSCLFSSFSHESCATGSSTLSLDQHVHGVCHNTDRFVTLKSETYCGQPLDRFVGKSVQITRIKFLDISHAIRMSGSLVSPFSGNNRKSLLSLNFPMPALEDLSPLVTGCGMGFVRINACKFTRLYYGEGDDGSLAGLHCNLCGSRVLMDSNRVNRCLKCPLSEQSVDWAFYRGSGFLQDNLGNRLDVQISGSAMAVILSPWKASNVSNNCSSDLIRKSINFLTHSIILNALHYDVICFCEKGTTKGPNIWILDLFCTK